MRIKLIKKNNEGFTPDAIKRFTVDDPNYIDHIIIPDKKNGDDVIVKIVRGTEEHPLFSGTMYYGRALRSSATEPFSAGMGSLKLMADWLDNLAKQDPEESLADLDAIEQRAKSEKREGATGSIEIKEGPQEGDLIYTPAAQSVAKKLGDDLLMAILAAASDEAWSQADEYEWKDAVDTDHGLEWNTCQALGWGFDDMDKAAPFKGDSGKVYSGDVAKNAYNAIAALAEDDRYSLFFNNQPRNYSHIRDVVATAMDMAADDESEDESKRNEALSPKMQQRRKLKAWQDASMRMKGFAEAGHSFLDMIDGETFNSIFLPVNPKPTKEEGEKVAEKIFGDFEGYLEYGTDYDEADEDGGWLPYYGLTKEFLNLPEGEGLEVLSELSDVLYKAYTKGESASEDRRGTDRYGHPVKRFTTKDLKGLDGEVISGDDAGTPSNFGLAYLDTTSMDALSNDFRTQECDRFLHDLAQMPVSKKSIEDLLRKHKLHKFGDTIGVRDFFPENGIAYLGTYASDGLPYKDLCLRWGPALKK